MDRGQHRTPPPLTTEDETPGNPCSSGPPGVSVVTPHAKGHAMTRRQTTTNRGLGWHHQQTRTRLLNRHRNGTPCWWCDRPMYRQPDDNFDHAPLEADHTIARSQGGRTADRLLHMTCNRERGDGTRDHLRPALTGHSTPPATDEPDDLRIMPWPW